MIKVKEPEPRALGYIEGRWQVNAIAGVSVEDNIRAGLASGIPFQDLLGAWSFKYQGYLDAAGNPASAALPESVATAFTAVARGMAYEPSPFDVSHVKVTPEMERAIGLAAEGIAAMGRGVSAGRIAEEAVEAVKIIAATGGASAEELGDETVADAILDTVDVQRHEARMRVLADGGAVYGTEVTTDASGKVLTHPDMLPFEQISASARKAYRDVDAAVVRALRAVGADIVHQPSAGYEAARDMVDGMVGEIKAENGTDRILAQMEKDFLDYVPRGYASPYLSFLSERVADSLYSQTAALAAGPVKRHDGFRRLADEEVGRFLAAGFRDGLAEVPHNILFEKDRNGRYVFDGLMRKLSEECPDVFRVLQDRGTFTYSGSDPALRKEFFDASVKALTATRDRLRRDLPPDLRLSVDDLRGRDRKWRMRVAAAAVDGYKRRLSSPYSREHLEASVPRRDGVPAAEVISGELRRWLICMVTGCSWNDSDPERMLKRVSDAVGEVAGHVRRHSTAVEEYRARNAVSRLFTSRPVPPEGLCGKASDALRLASDTFRLVYEVEKAVCFDVRHGNGDFHIGGGQDFVDAFRQGVENCLTGFAAALNAMPKGAIPASEMDTLRRDFGKALMDVQDFTTYDVSSEVYHEGTRVMSARQVRALRDLGLSRDAVMQVATAGEAVEVQAAGKHVSTVTIGMVDGRAVLMQPGAKDGVCVDSVRESERAAMIERYRIREARTEAVRQKPVTRDGENIRSHKR